MPLDDPGQLIYLSAASLAQRIREKNVAAQEAVKAYRARIARVNPQLNAAVQLCAERPFLKQRAA
jgi:Asp-tRNA(Asn)/Glu-tRNA(Gln) amidotransferase A subunit family amidase